MGQPRRKKLERRVARSRPDLLEAFREQVRFLHRAAGHFDDGDEAEAKNLAAHLRKLLHDDGRRCVSVLSQLGERDRMRYIDTAPVADPRNLMPMAGLAAWKMGDDGARWLATLDQQPPERTGRMSTFPTWWQGKVTKDAHGVLWSREDLVLHVANQDGGAHVDPSISQPYSALTRENGMGWRVHAAGTEDEGVPMLGNPVLVSIRQVAWELDWTLRLRLWRELGLAGVQAHRFRPPDPLPSDDRLANGEFEHLPYVSFRFAVDGGPTGKTVQLSHPANLSTEVTRPIGGGLIVSQYPQSER